MNAISAWLFGLLAVAWAVSAARTSSPATIALDAVVAALSAALAITLAWQARPRRSPSDRAIRALFLGGPLRRVRSAAHRLLAAWRRRRNGFSASLRRRLQLETRTWGGDRDRARQALKADIKRHRQLWRNLPRACRRGECPALCPHRHGRIPEEATR